MLTTRAYQARWLRADLVAGLTVTALLIPEGMAYAQLAGVPPQAAFSAAPAALLLYAVLGTSRQLVVAVSSAVAITSAAIVGELAPAGGAQYAEYVSDPAKPVPYRVRPVLPMYNADSTWRQWLVDDQRPFADRTDVLTFASEPLTEPLTISGEVSATLFASTTGTDSDWVVKLIDVFPPEQQEQIRIMFSDSMLAILCQSLLRKRSGGRVAAMEILLGTPAVRNLIREGKAHQIPSAMQTGKSAGMQTMDASLLELVRSGTVSMEQARLHASAPELLGASGQAQPERPPPAGRLTPLRSS